MILLVSVGTFWASADGESFERDRFFTSLVTGLDAFSISVEPTFGTSTTARGLAWLTDTSELSELGDISIEWLTVGKIRQGSISSIKFFTSNWVLLGFFSFTSEDSANSSLRSFHISLGTNTLLEVLLLLEVGFSLLLVLLNRIGFILVTVASFESIKISLFKVLKSDSLVEDWASFDALNLGGRVGVLGVL